MPRKHIPLTTTRRIRLAVDCDVDLFLDLLTVLNLHGVRPDIGIASPARVPIKRYAKRESGSRRSRRGSRRQKPKRHSRMMSVRVAAQPPDGLSPSEIKVLGAIRAEFGTDPFEKRFAKRAVLRRIKAPGVTSHITALMDKRALVPTVNGMIAH